MQSRIINNQHSATVILGDCEFYFSYEELIAFKIGNNPLVISENYWEKTKEFRVKSLTTELHINELERDKSKRLPREEFLQEVNSLCTKTNIALNT